MTATCCAPTALHEVADAAAIASVLLTVGDPDQAAQDLIALAIEGGGPDNITCIVADVMPQQVPATVPTYPA